MANGELLKSYLDAQADGTKKSVEEIGRVMIGSAYRGIEPDFPLRPLDLRGECVASGKRALFRYGAGFGIDK